MARRGLTHLDSHQQPAMVDVGAKEVTQRVAVAEARVRLPPGVARALRAAGHRTRKGPVFDTAIVAGVQAAKRTRGGRVHALRRNETGARPPRAGRRFATRERYRTIANLRSIVVVPTRSIHT